MNSDRRSVLAALGLALPFGRTPGLTAAGPAPGLRFRPFEEQLRQAFASPGVACCRVEVGHAEAVAAGLQGCVNDRPFAGFAAGRLRIVRAGSAPGPAVGGVRLYVGTVDVAVVEPGTAPGRPLDFRTVPPAPVLSAEEETSGVTLHRRAGKING